MSTIKDTVGKVVGEVEAEVPVVESWVKRNAWVWVVVAVVAVAVFWIV